MGPNRWNDEGFMRCYRLQRHFRLSLLWVCLLFLNSWALAQAPTPTPVIITEGSVEKTPVSPSPTGTPTADSQPAPPSTETPFRYQSTVTHRKLFLVAGTANYTAEERAHLIARRVENVLADVNGESLPPVTLQERESDVVLMFGDQLLATILPGDVLAQFPDQTMNPETLRQTAERWRSELEADLKEGHSFRNPLYFWTTAGVIAVFFLLFLWLHFQVESRLARKTAVPGWLLRTGLWTLFLVMCLWANPSSRQWAIHLYETAFRPVIWAIVVIFTASVVVHFFESAVHRYFRALLNDGRLPETRRFRRLATLEQVALVTGRTTLVFIAIIIFLAQLPINYGPLMASLGVIGVAFGFAAQDTLRDLFSGVSILVEDRFGVGDWIEWNTHSGLVESFNLKTTRIRAIDGSVLTLSNADLRVVRNLSNEWAQVDFKIGIAYESDFRHAIECLMEEANILADEWPDRIIAEPELKGLEKLGESSVVLRVYVRTQPLAQWDVGRELNARVKERFDKEGISIPYPQRGLWIKENQTQTTHTEAHLEKVEE